MTLLSQAETKRS